MGSELTYDGQGSYFLTMTVKHLVCGFWPKISEERNVCYRTAYEKVARSYWLSESGLRFQFAWLVVELRFVEYTVVCFWFCRVISRKNGEMTRSRTRLRVVP